MNTKLFFKTAALCALAIIVVACNVGGAIPGTGSVAAPASTPTPTLVSAAPTATQTPTLAPTAVAGVVTPVLGLTPHWTNTPPAPAATLTPMPTPNYPATITALAPVPTTASATATIGAPGTTGVSPLCPKLDEARAAFGVDVTLVGTESCAYTWNSGDSSFKSVNRASGWIINSAEVDGLIYVRAGNGETVQAKASTWRYVKPVNGNSLYPGLTLEKQFELLSGYAALPQNAFASLIRCPECAGFPPAVPAGAAPTCPAVTGFTSSKITGGCLYKATNPTNFVIPAGWQAYYGVPAVWVTSGMLNNVTQVSLYKQ